MQTTNSVLMVRPIRFSFNEQTATNNAFQEKGIPAEESQSQALKEFDNYVSLLREAGINVIVVEDSPEPHTPDSIFPNNWFSTHTANEIMCKKEKDEASHTEISDSGAIVLYPMFAENRRMERKIGVFKAIVNLDKSHLKAMRTKIDLTPFESKGKFLEGTGSMILDRENKIVYACESARTNQDVLEKFAEETGYRYFLFSAKDIDGLPIYHTNVMMSVGSKYAIVCLDAVQNLDEREHLIELLEENGKEIIEISLDQVYEFAGNMLELHNKENHPVLIMSARAKASLTKEQVSTIESYCKIIAPDLEYIEKNGGGSARCMLAEIF